MSDLEDDVSDVEEGAADSEDLGQELRSVDLGDLDFDGGVSEGDGTGDDDPEAPPPPLGGPSLGAPSLGAELRTHEVSWPTASDADQEGELEPTATGALRTSVADESSVGGGGPEGSLGEWGTSAGSPSVSFGEDFEAAPPRELAAPQEQAMLTTTFLEQGSPSVDRELDGDHGSVGDSARVLTRSSVQVRWQPELLNGAGLTGPGLPGSGLPGSGLAGSEGDDEGFDSFDGDGADSAGGELGEIPNVPADLSAPDAFPHPEPGQAVKARPAPHPSRTRLSSAPPMLSVSSMPPMSSEAGGTAEVPQRPPIPATVEAFALEESADFEALDEVVELDDLEGVDELESSDDVAEIQGEEEPIGGDLAEDGPPPLDRQDGVNG